MSRLNRTIRFGLLSVPAIAKVREIKTVADYEKVLKSSNTRLLMFYATWCPYCKKAHPILESYSTKYDCKFYKVDVDKLPSICMDIESMPTIRMVRKQKILDSMTGIDKTDLKAMIKKFCKKKAV